MMREYGRKKSSSKSVGTRSARHQSKSPRNGSNSAKKVNEKGEITSWDTNNQDGRELKIYVENGCCDGLTAKPIREKYPQFVKYSYSTFNSALANARKAFNHQVRNRAQGLCEYFLRIYIYLFVLTHPIISFLFI